MISGIESFELSEEMQKRLDNIKPADNIKFKFTKEQDYIIKNYYETKNKHELAKLMGCSRDTLLKRYKELK